MKRVEVRCVCGCGILVAEQYDGKDTDIDLAYYELGFGAYQSRTLGYFRRLWAALLGRRYLLFDIIITEAEFKKLSTMLEEAVSP